MELSFPIEQTWLANLSFKYLGFEMKTSTKRAIEFGTWSQIMFPQLLVLWLYPPKTSSQASKLRYFETLPTYSPSLTHLLTGVKCNATSVAKNTKLNRMVNMVNMVIMVIIVIMVWMQILLAVLGNIFWV